MPVYKFMGKTYSSVADRAKAMKAYMAKKKAPTKVPSWISTKPKVITPKGQEVLKKQLGQMISKGQLTKPVKLVGGPSLGTVTQAAKKYGFTPPAGGGSAPPPATTAPPPITTPQTKPSVAPTEPQPPGAAQFGPKEFGSMFEKSIQKYLGPLSKQIAALAAKQAAPYTQAPSVVEMLKQWRKQYEEPYAGAIQKLGGLAGQIELAQRELPEDITRRTQDFLITQAQRRRREMKERQTLADQLAQVLASERALTGEREAGRAFIDQLIGAEETDVSRKATAAELQTSPLMDLLGEGLKEQLSQLPSFAELTQRMQAETGQQRLALDALKAAQEGEELSFDQQRQLADLALKVPEGQSMQVGDYVIEGMKSPDPEVGWTTVTDAQGNVSVIYADKRTRETTVVPVGKIGKGLKGGVGGGIGGIPTPASGLGFDPASIPTYEQILEIVRDDPDVITEIQAATKMGYKKGPAVSLGNQARAYAKYLAGLPEEEEGPGFFAKLFGSANTIPPPTEEEKKKMSETMKALQSGGGGLGLGSLASYKPSPPTLIPPPTEEEKKKVLKSLSKLF